MRLLELFSGTHSIGKVAHNLGFEVISLDRDLEGECPLKTDYKSDIHIKEDIMKWDYKIYNKGDFDIITASPVCLYWSALRNTWIGRKSKTINPDGSIVKKEDIQRDIDLIGKPMVDKIFEIIEYFEPKYWWIENPQTGRMKHYITEKWSQYDTYYDFDYCKYSNWGYKKSTRFWTNIKDIKPLTCKNDCENMLVIDNQHLHKNRMGTGKTINDNGKIVRVNTKALREKYKDYDNIQLGKKHKKSVDGGKKKLHKVSMGSWGKEGTEQTGIGSGSNRLERYRIPEKLIEELFLCIL
tara:strand:+ start:1274 stop:2161 length:888 start_codon:yes stop_codon:yes gene_type:complete